MLAEIKRQFYESTLKDLEIITQKLLKEELTTKEYPELAEEIFSLSHQICGTGPMLGFNTTSKLSRKLEKTFYEIKAGQKNLTPQLIWQTRRALETLISAFKEENNNQLQ